MVISEEPDFFTWVESGLLAAHAFPGKPGHLQYLVDNGINILISLTPERKPPGVDLIAGLSYMPINIKDFTPPTMEQIDEFMAVVESAKLKKQAVSVHCMMGRGRTGSLIACYLAKTYLLDATQAIARTRFLRPGSIETLSQEKVIAQYIQQLKCV